MTTLCVSAVDDELGGLPGVALGVGPIAAAAAAARLVATRHPRRVVLLGTAGRYRSGPAIGAVIAAGPVGWEDGAAALGLAYVPRPPPRMELEPVGLPAASVLTVGAITTDPELAGRFGERWEVEHLETYGVALACREAGVPFVAILGITNDVGPDAHQQWLEHRVAVQDAVRAAVRTLIGD